MKIDWQEVGGTSYAHRGLPANTIHGNQAGEFKLNPPMGEVERMLIDVEQLVQGLADDSRMLAEKLESALTPTLVESNDIVGIGRADGLPASRIGRRLLELAGEVRKLRGGLQDLTARVAL